MVSSTSNLSSGSFLVSVLRFGNTRVSNPIVSALLVCALSCATLAMTSMSAGAAPVNVVEFSGKTSYCSWDGNAKIFKPIGGLPAKYTTATLPGNAGRYFLDLSGRKKALCIGESNPSSIVTAADAGRMLIKHRVRVRGHNIYRLNAYGHPVSGIDGRKVPTKVTADLLASTEEPNVLTAKPVSGAMHYLSGYSKKYPLLIMLYAGPKDVNYREADAAYVATMKIDAYTHAANVRVNLNTEHERDVSAFIINETLTVIAGNPVIIQGSSTNNKGTRLAVINMRDTGLVNEYQNLVVRFLYKLALVVQSGRVRTGYDAGNVSNNYTDGTHVMKGAALKGHQTAFGTGAIHISALGSVVLANSNASNKVSVFPNVVDGELDNTADTGGTLWKINGGPIRFTKDLKRITVYVAKGNITLWRTSDASTAKFGVGKGGNLNLGGVPVRTIGGIVNSIDIITLVAKDFVYGNGDPFIIGGGDNVELVLDVNDPVADFLYKGTIKGITKLTKTGTRLQKLHGKVFQALDGSGNEIPLPGGIGVAEESALEVLPSTLFGASVDLSAGARLLVFRDDVSKDENFVSPVTGPEGTLVKVGKEPIRFSGTSLPALFHVKESEAILSDGLVAADTLFMLDWNGVLSLDADTVIGGLRSGVVDGKNRAGKVKDHDLTNKLHELTIRVPQGKEYLFDGDIEDVKKIIIDGPGAQIVYGKITRSADPINGVLPTEEIIHVKAGSKFHVKAEMLSEVSSGPIRVDKTGVLIVRSSENNAILENPLKGAGAVELHDGVKATFGGLDAPDAMLDVMDGQVDLEGTDITFAGLRSSDVHAIFLNGGADDNAMFTVAVPENMEAVYMGRLGTHVRFKMKGKGKQVIGISEGHEGDLNVEDGVMVVKVMKPTEAPDEDEDERGCAREVSACIKAPINVAEESEMDLVLEEDLVELKKHIALQKNAELKIYSAEGTGKNAVMYTYAPPQDGDEEVQTRSAAPVEDGKEAFVSLKVVKLVIGKDSANPAKFPANLKVEDGGEVSGSGEITGIVVLKKGGILAPGHSTGGLSAPGWVLGADSVYTVEIKTTLGTDWEADIITVTPDPDEATGVVIEENVDLVLRKIGKVEALNAEKKPIVIGYKTGEFRNIHAEDFKMTPILTYEPSEGLDGKIYLSWVPRSDETKFEEIGTTSNQKVFGAYIDRLNETHPVYGAIAGLSDSDTVDVMNALSGEIYLAGMGAILETSDVMMMAVTRRMQDGSKQDRLNGFVDEEGKTKSETYNPRKRKKINENFIIWGDKIMKYGEVIGYGSGNAELTSLSLGGILGVDVDVAPIRAGVAIAGTSETYGIEDTGRKSEGRLYSYQASLYGSRYFAPNLELRGSIVVGSHAVSVSRKINIEAADLNQELEASYMALSTRIALEVAKVDFFYVNDKSYKGTAELFSRIEYAALGVEKFAEKGKIVTASLSVDAATHSTVDSIIGLRGAVCLSKCSGSDPMEISASFMFAWQHKWSGEKPSAELRFSLDKGTGMPNVSSAPSAGSDSAVFGLGLSLKPTDNTSVGLEATGKLSSSAASGGLSLKLSVGLP